MLQKKLKKNIGFIMLMFTMVLINALPALANEEKVILSDEQIVAEINAYMELQDNAFDLENQVRRYQIPLSNGEVATITHELKRVPGQPAPRDIFTAKLGNWDFTSTYKVGIRGSITVTTRVNVTHVPDMNSSTQDMVKFTASGGKVSAVPMQTVSINGTSAKTSMIQRNYEYETTGYVGFRETTGITINYYFTQTISYVGNSGNDRDKIYCGLSVTL